MSKQSESSQQERKELPIERGFPIERVNEMVEKEGRAKQWYRPIYTMHKWWARRLGCVFRPMLIYSLATDASEISVYEPGKNQSLSESKFNENTIQSLIDNISSTEPEGLWDIYPKDVRINNKKILDPFMGGGTSIVESSRLGISSVGNDLNPVAWFVVKKEIETGRTDVEKFRNKFEELDESIGNEVRQYYKTNCPNSDHKADVMYYRWAKELDCVSCGTTVPLFNDFRAGKARYDSSKYDVFCPSCEQIIRVEDWQSECCCDECGFDFVPKEGYVSGGDYTCYDCGQKYSIVDAVQEQDGFGLKLFAVEFYCETCDDDGLSKGEVTGYKSPNEFDLELYQQAEREWENSPELHKYTPDTEIPLGIMTDSTAFDGSIGGGHNLLSHGFSDWSDLYNKRQLLSLSKILHGIDQIEDQNIKEYLLLAFSDALRSNTILTNYSAPDNQINHVFKTNSFDSPQQPAENNAWGAAKGGRTFRGMVDMVARGIEYGNSPVERYVENDETKKSTPFEQPIGENCELHQDDVRNLEYENEFDAVITDPPYYNNIIYSEISNFFYVWLRILLKDEYSEFDEELTPRAESIVANPAEGKGAEEFEMELREAFENIHTALKSDGVLSFTYHHSDSESWGELLTALCDVGFQVTAAYPISADLSKHPVKIGAGDSVSFDIIVVARPIGDRESVSWNSLRRDIYRTARRTRKKLEASREISRGDIGVMEMGACFREYSKYHGKVQRDGEIMSAKEVVKEIYGIIQEASDIGVEDVFIDLLDTPRASYDDVNKLCRGTNATPEDLKETALYNQGDGFEIGTWDNEKRQAYIQERVNGDGGEHLTNLDKLQFLRYRYEKGQAVQNYVEKWNVDDNLRELAGRLADVTGDETYTRVLGDRDITSY